MLMKDGAILCNAGHFDVEVCVPDLESMAVEKKEQRKNIMGYMMPDGRWLNLLGEGRLVNLAAGDGHPAEFLVRFHDMAATHIFSPELCMVAVEEIETASHHLGLLLPFSIRVHFETLGEQGFFYDKAKIGSDTHSGFEGRGED